MGPSQACCSCVSEAAPKPTMLSTPGLSGHWQKDPGCSPHTHGRPKCFTSLWGPLGRVPWANYPRHHNNMARNLVCNAAVVSDTCLRITRPIQTNTCARGAISMDTDLPGDPFPYSEAWTSQAGAMAAQAPFPSLTLGVTERTSVRGPRRKIPST